MINEKNKENFNNQQVVEQNETKPQDFQINIIKVIENKKIIEPKRNNNNKNVIFSLGKKKNSSKRIKDIKKILENSFRSKYTKKEDEPIKGNKSCNNIIENNSNFEESINSKNTKSERNCKNNINTNTNQFNNNSNKNILNKNYFSFTDNLYKNEEHLQKNIVSNKNKDGSSKSVTNNRLLYIGRVNSITQKKNLIGSKIFEKQSDKNSKDFLGQKNIKLPSKFKNQDKKSIFTNNSKENSPNKANIKKTYTRYLTEKSINFSNKNNITDNRSNNFLYKNKGIILKNGNNKEQKIPNINNNNKKKSKADFEINKKEVENANSINNLKTKNDELANDINTYIGKKKRKKFCLFCCFNVYEKD